MAGIVFFGATIDGLGLAPTLFATTFVAALAGHRVGPLKALAISVGLTVLSLGIFVGLLQLRLPLFGDWLGARVVDLRTGPGARDGPPAEQHPDLSARRHARHHGGRAPGHRADRHRRAAAPDHLQLRPDRVADHARRHLLRRAVRRSTTAILINLPGESSAAVTALDGHQMARQGRAGPALATAALGSFFAGTVATAFVALFAPPMASVALEFGPADYFSLVVLGLVISIALASGSTVKALAMIVLGLLLGTVGQDLFSTGVPVHLRHPRALPGPRLRLDRGRPVRPGRDHPQPGAPADPERGDQEGAGAVAQPRRLPPDPDAGAPWHRDGLRARRPARRRARPGGVHVVLGGEAGVEAPREVRRGAIEGGASPESANNAAAQTSFIPLLTLGLPAHPVMALLVGRSSSRGSRPDPMSSTTSRSCSGA